jgi:nitrous oxidase accessory protein NosD
MSALPFLRSIAKQFLWMAVASGFCPASVLTVGPGRDFETIQAAVAAAAPNDTLEVSSGHFAEVVVVDKPLGILGANDGVSIGTYSGVRGEETLLSGGLQVTSGGEGTVISGFRIETGMDDGDAKTGVLIDAASVTLRDSVIASIGSLPSPAADSHGLRVTSNGDNAVLSGNRFEACRTGFRIDAATNVVIHGNRISDHTVAGISAGAGSSGVLLRDNQLVGNGLAVANGSTSPVDAIRNYWSSSQSPPSQGGPNGWTGEVLFSPWFADAEMQTLINGLVADTVIGDGEVLNADVLQIDDGITLTVERGSVSANQIDLKGGGVIEVIDGDLKFGVPGGGSHTIAGTFRIMHSLGSIDIMANTTFSGDTLALVSDFNIADGVSLTITGSLVMDGCRLRGSGSFDIVLNSDARLEMVRCEIRGASMFLVGSELRLVDNLFYDSTGFVFGTVQGGEVFHNVFHGGLDQFTILPGGTVTTDVEGWGNVTTLEDARNRLMLEWMAPLLPGRTLDTTDGALYVQPGDEVRLAIDSGGFTSRIQGAELLMAYHSDYLALSGFNPASPWDNLLHLEDQPLSVFGKVDIAHGFGFAYEDPDGTLEDNVIGNFGFTAGSTEGRTLVFFREKDVDDNPLIDTRLTTSSGGMATYIEFPFTRNSGTLVIDGTDPVIDEGGASVTQDLGDGPVDLLEIGNFTRQGVVGISFAAYDDLAGIAPGAVTVEFAGPQLFTATPSGTADVVINGLPYTQYEFTLSVGNNTPNGLYDVLATVVDRSGNSSQVLLGTVDVARLIATVDVQSQGLVATPMTRDVTFVATDASGDVLESRVVSVDFVGGIGQAVLAGLPDATANLSAKTGWTLRRRLPCLFDANGDSEVSFTGASQLRGGDLNGDNIVNLVDYNILNGNWFTTNAAADISGDGVVNVFDFNILNSNWFSIGDTP